MTNIHQTFITVMKLSSNQNSHHSNLIFIFAKLSPNTNKTSVGGRVGFSSNPSSTWPASREVLLSYKTLSLLKENLLIVFALPPTKERTQTSSRAQFFSKWSGKQISSSDWSVEVISEGGVSGCQIMIYLVHLFNNFK